MRIASLVPSSTELLFALGLGDEVVAVTHECDYPAGAAELPHLSETVIPPGLSPSGIDAEVKRLVGRGEPLYRLKADVLEEVRPDLIVAQDVCAVCAVSYEDVVSIAARLPGNPAVLRQDPTTLAEVMDNAGEVAEAAGRPELGRALRASMEARLAAVERAVGGRECPSVLALEWLDPPFTGGHWIPEMIRLAGGRDPVASPGEKSRETTWAELAGLDPDVAVVMPCGYDSAKAAEQARRYGREIEKTGARRVVAVDAAASFSRPGPRLIDGVELLAGILHGYESADGTLAHEFVAS
jgi:iron complex transport system substrate-binding protein